MSLVKWLDEAVRYTAGAVRMMPPQERGVVPTEFPDVTLIFAPSEDRQRITDRLVAAGIESRGEGRSLNAWNGYTVGMLVVSTDVKMLSEIVSPIAV